MQERVEQVIERAIRIWGPKAVKPGEGWSVESIAQSLIKHCKANKVELELALAQAYVECHFGVNPDASRSRRTLNIFNVGNVDDGKDRKFKSWDAGIKAYAELMRREYDWKEGEYITVESMLKHDFKRPKGGRYATAKNYTDVVVQMAMMMRNRYKVQSSKFKVQS